MQVIVKERALENLIAKLVKEERSFHTKNVNELEKAAPPILPQPEMAQQLSTTKMPVEDNEFVPSNKNELGKAAMQLANQVEDDDIHKFYENFKSLIKKFKNQEAQIKEAKLPGFLGQPEEEPVPKDRQARRAARLRASEPEQPYMSTTPAEDAADIAASMPASSTKRQTPDVEKKRKRSSTRQTKTDLRDPGAKFDPVAEYLKSLRRPRPRPDWMKNVQMNLSDMVVGDANKLIMAIVKKMGEENITEENLESSVLDAIQKLTYEINGDKIVISSPEYKVKFEYNTEGNPNNLFSLDQYKETLTGLASQKSAGVGSQESWGPKYAQAIQSLRYALGDQALERALLQSLPVIQQSLTDAVLDSYPMGTDEFNTKEIADKLDMINDQVVDAFTQSLRPGFNTITQDILGKEVELTLEIPETPVALRAIEDARFSGVLMRLLSATPEELRAYVSKKRALRSAVKMSRSDENYFYSLGKRMGGENFKMSAAQFKEKLLKAMDARDEFGVDMTDEQLVNMVLISGDIISKSQIEMLSTIQNKLCSEFKSLVKENAVFEKKIKDEDLIPDVENFDDVPANMRQIYRVFMDEFIEAFTDKINVGPEGFKNLQDLEKRDSDSLFDIYDAATVDRSNFSGVEATHLYGDPGKGRRAKDLSNFVGNLRHVANFLKSRKEEMSKMGRTIASGHLDVNSKKLSDPGFIIAAIDEFLGMVGNLPPEIERLLDKATGKAASSIAELFKNPDNLPIPRGARRERPSRDAGVATATNVEPDVELPAEPVQPEIPIVDPAAVSKTYDNIISVFNKSTQDMKDEMLSAFEETVLVGQPTKAQLEKYPALTTAADYEALLNMLEQLNEATTRSLLLSLIHGYTRR